MNLFSMSLNNLKKNFKNCWAFFLSTTFSVFVLYLFMSIRCNSDVKDQLGSMRSFIYLFLIASYLTAFFSAFFIWYANSFFIKSRKKEFATLMLLGMSKKQTARFNFIENFIIMFSAFCTGIILGLIFNKFFIMLLYAMIRATGNVQFQISIPALKYCFIVFTIVFILISIHSSVLIKKNELIDLLNASKQPEKSLKVSAFTIAISILSIAFLGYGYYLAVDRLVENIILGPVVVLLVIIGTVLLFTGLTSLLLYYSKRNEKRLFKGTRLISTSQLCYRYKGNVGTLSVIAVTTTIALCAMISCFGTFDKAEENSRYMRPYSVEYHTNSITDKSVQDTLKNHKEISVKYKDDIEFLQVKTKSIFHGQDDFLVLNESEFDKINSHEKVDRKANLKSEKDCYFFQIANFVPDKSVVGQDVKLSQGSKEYNLKIIDTDNKPFIALDHSKATFIVKDSVYNEMKNSIDKDSILKITGYGIKNDIFQKKLVSDLRNKIHDKENLLTFREHYMEGLQLVGMMAFIGIFIGLLFITATGSIIYFRISMEAQEDKNKFIILRKIGVSKSEIRKAISKELIVLFGLPFLVAAISTAVASIPLSKMMAFHIYKELVIIVLVYAVLYSIYYLITLNSYVKTVSE